MENNKVEFVEDRLTILKDESGAFYAHLDREKAWYNTWAIVDGEAKRILTVVGHIPITELEGLRPVELFSEDPSSNYENGIEIQLQNGMRLHTTTDDFEKVVEEHRSNFFNQNVITIKPLNCCNGSNLPYIRMFPKDGFKIEEVSNDCMEYWEKLNDSPVLKEFFVKYETEQLYYVYRIDQGEVQEYFKICSVSEQIAILEAMNIFESLGNGCVYNYKWHAELWDPEDLILVKPSKDSEEIIGKMPCDRNNWYIYNYGLLKYDTTCYFVNASNPKKSYTFTSIRNGEKVVYGLHDTVKGKEESKKDLVEPVQDGSNPEDEYTVTEEKNDEEQSIADCYPEEDLMIEFKTRDSYCEETKFSKYTPPLTDDFLESVVVPQFLMRGWNHTDVLKNCIPVCHYGSSGLCSMEIFVNGQKVAGWTNGVVTFTDFSVHMTKELEEWISDLLVKMTTKEKYAFTIVNAGCYDISTYEIEAYGVNHAFAIMFMFLKDNPYLVPIESIHVGKVREDIDKRVFISCKGEKGDYCEEACLSIGEDSIGLAKFIVYKFLAYKLDYGEIDSFEAMFAMKDKDKQLKNVVRICYDRRHLGWRISYSCESKVSSDTLEYFSKVVNRIGGELNG